MAKRWEVVFNNGKAEQTITVDSVLLSDRTIEVVDGNTTLVISADCFIRLGKV